MSSEAKRLNWVERRFLREKSLAEQSSMVWNAVRSRLQDACDSFRKYYLTSGKLEDLPENGHRLLVTRTSPATASSYAVNLHVLVDYSSKDATITVTHDIPGASRIFQIDADETKVFVCEGDAALDPDEVSQRILEPLLFPGPVRAILMPKIGERVPEI